MDKKIIFFDLDDTLIDTKLRHYRVVEDYLKNKGVKSETLISFHDYVNIRRIEKLSNLQYLIKYYNHIENKDFKFFFNENIESPKYLEYDSEIVDYDNLVKLRFKYKCDLKILSLRSNKDNAVKELERYLFKDIFSNFYFISHSFTSNPKEEFLRNFTKKEDVLFFIGDSESDYEASKKNSIDFIGVRTGFYESSLMRFNNINELLMDFIR